MGEELKDRCYNYLMTRTSNYEFRCKIKRYASKGAVFTTPNSAVVDVIACDPTHVSVLEAETCKLQGWVIRTAECFCQPMVDGQQDTLIGRWRR